jgi:hypothetical protein
LKQALQKKCSRSHETNGLKISLLSTYSRQTPVEPPDLLFDCADILKKILSRGTFLSEVFQVLGRVFRASKRDRTISIKPVKTQRTYNTALLKASERAARRKTGRYVLPKEDDPFRVTYRFIKEKAGV